jgi:hypothetical protein
MTALIVVSDSIDTQRVSEFFDTYEILELKTDPSSFYEEANNAVTHAKKFNPVFVVVGQPTLTAIVTAKFARVRSFYIASWTGKRYVTLKIP